MKKRILILTMTAAIAMSLTACGGSSDTKVIEGNSANTAATTTTTSATGYVFNYKGTDIPVDAEAAPIIEALGEASSYFESPSCAADGIGKVYTYSDVEVETYPDGDVDKVLAVRLLNDTVSTAEGIDLSSSKDDIVAAYGDATEETDRSLKYEKDGMSLVFIFGDNGLISIEYDSALNK
ncbi:MAG: hypothetical protein IKP29_02610 [Pseudobutyrivibrio sp.]|nr:hypothetical protein [Pseudobutyrivibrio sp.]